MVQYTEKEALSKDEKRGKDQCLPGGVKAGAIMAPWKHLGVIWCIDEFGEMKAN